MALFDYTNAFFAQNRPINLSFLSQMHLASHNDSGFTDQNSSIVTAEIETVTFNGIALQYALADKIPSFISGTLTSYAFARGGETIVSISGMNISAKTFFEKVAAEDWTGVADLMSSGNDTLLGKETNDFLYGGALADKIYGAAGDDHLYGGTGKDRISGGLGNDTLNGGAGADVFVFDTSKAGNADRIADFKGTLDQIALNRHGFLHLNTGLHLQDAAFVLGLAAKGAEDRILYDQSTGRVFFDDDGTGAHHAVLFARLAANTVLHAEDFNLFGV